MKTLGVILLSVGLNLALLYLNARLLLSPPPPELAAPVVHRVVTNTVWRVERSGGSAPPTVTNPPPRIAFHWSQIEAPEYPVYIANLRKFDCPERTIQNIIIADVSKHYETRAAELEATDVERFWVSGSTIFKRQREHLNRQRALEGERLRLLQQLLGIDPLADTRVTNRNPSIDDGRALQQMLLYSHLAPAKRDAALRLLQRSEQLGQALEAPVRNLGLGPDDEATRSLRAERAGELRQLLTAEELAEITCRVAAFKLKFAGLQLTAAELRSLAQIHARDRDLFSFVERIEEPADPAVAGRDIQALLGPQRWLDYQRAQDGRFEQFLNFTEQNGLPKTSAIRAYDIRAATESAAEAISRDDTRPDEESSRLLRELQTAAASKLRLELGATLAEKYFEQDSAWLKDLSKPRSPEPTKGATPRP